MPDLYTIGNDQAIRAAETAAFVKAGGFGGNDLVMALAISRAESGWKYDAKGGPNSNGTYDWGLFQINDVNHPTDVEKTHPIENARHAHALFVASGWKPWSTYNSGAYKQYLPVAKAAVAELNKRGSDFEKQALAKNGSATVASPGEIAALSPSSPFDAIGKTLSDVANRFSSFFNLGLGVVVGVVLLILGIVLLSRGFASRVVAGTLKEAAKSANKTATAAPKPVKTVEERARASLDYSAARKRLANEDARAAAAAARAKLRHL